MKKILLFFIVLNVFNACRFKTGSGNIVSENRQVGAFSGVSISSGIKAEILQAAGEQVRVEADDNLVKLVKTTVSDGQLLVQLDDVNVNEAHLKVFISANELNNIKASSGSEILLKNNIKADKLIEIKSSSAGSIEGSVDAPRLDVDASSGSTIKLSGKTRDLEVEVSSGSTVNAFDLMSESTKVSASSGGTAKVHASVKLDASASSGGNIKYHGSAADVKKSESSGGGVHKTAD